MAQKKQGPAASGGNAHPGFKAVQKKIASSEGMSMDEAGAVLAKKTRNASAQAKADNPNLKKVKGASK